MKIELGIHPPADMEGSFVNFYALISLAVVFGLLIWWLFLALSCLRKEGGDKEGFAGKMPGAEKAKKTLPIH
jgi:hypothetical protein